MAFTSKFAETIFLDKYAHTKEEGGKESWDEMSYRVVKNVLRTMGVRKNSEQFKSTYELVRAKKFVPGGRYLYAAGRELHQVQNCLALQAEDSREGWADLIHKATMALMTGAGVGVEYSKIRASGKPIRKTGGVASGPLALMEVLNSVGRGVVQGGSRRSAQWAGLNWSHPDIFKFIRAKDWSDEVKQMKEDDYSFPAPLDGMNISVGLDDRFFEAYSDPDHPDHSLAYALYWECVERMCQSGEPGFAVNVAPNENEILRNACTEFCSPFDSDVCNLGALNLARIETKEELEETINWAMAFLLAGSVYSDVPYAKVDTVRSQSRRIGLGLMGVHEWLLKRGKPYGKDEELGEWLAIYKEQSDKFGKTWADKWALTTPTKTRAIAPTGTISICAETTSGIEPIFCVAYKRRYYKNSLLHYQYVVDPTARRLIEQGINPDMIEDAFSLAETVDTRVEFQAWIQEYVDMGISSTVNLPAWGSEKNNKDTVKAFGDMLMKHLPRLRGITVYPDGGRGGGQPLTPVRYNTAIKRLGEELVEEVVDVCDLKGGSCSN